MANKEYLALLNRGILSWNEWRNKNLHLEPDLTNTYLRSINLQSINFQGVNLTEANL